VSVEIKIEGTDLKKDTDKCSEHKDNKVSNMYYYRAQENSFKEGREWQVYWDD
jgi:hypothetical protein